MHMMPAAVAYHSWYQLLRLMLLLCTLAGIAVAPDDGHGTRRDHVCDVYQPL